MGRAGNRRQQGRDGVGGITGRGGEQGNEKE
jgi:hypothetical protein